MNITRQSKFVPYAKHALDVKSFRQTQKAVNALLNSRIVQGSGNGFIHHADGSTVFELPAVDTTPLFPFKIYNTTNASLTSTQLAEFSAQGVNPNGLCFQIRNGNISGRPYLGVNVIALEGNLGNFPVQGNFEILFNIGTDSIPQTNPGGYVEDPLYPEIPNTNQPGLILPADGTPGLIWGIPPGSPASTPQTYNGQVFASPVPDDNGNSLAAFWVEIIDDPLNYFYLNLMGQMWTDNIFDSTGRGNSPFPTGPNIIPIGLGEYLGSGNDVVTNSDTTYVTNFQFGNLVNRYSGSGFYRGEWVELFAAIPGSAASGGLIFYPGDIVIDDSNSFAIGTDNFYGVYIFVNPSYYVLRVASNPSTYTEPYWQQIGLIEA